MEGILETFRSDLTPRDGRGGGYDYSPTVTGLAMGGSPNSRGVWKEASTNTDPAVLFIDRCLQLLKPGGRLLIVLPDGVLCNSGDRYVREYIKGAKDEASGEFHGGKAIVKGVISLPADAFYGRQDQRTLHSKAARADCRRGATNSWLERIQP